MNLYIAFGLSFIVSMYFIFSYHVLPPKTSLVEQWLLVILGGVIGMSIAFGFDVLKPF